MTTEDLTGENRCWPCTVANGAVGLLVGWLPFMIAVGRGDPEVLAGTIVWGVIVTAATAYRIVSRGYLPLAEPVAKLTGLDDWFGPGADDGDDDHD